MNKRKPVISHHAPKGHTAVAHDLEKHGALCFSCAFKYESMCPNVWGTHSCTSAKRVDGHTVIFVKP